MSPIAFVAVLAVCATLGRGARAQAAPAAPVASPAAGEKAWSFTAAGYVYLLPEDESDYGQPTFWADRGRLHLEARYQYEGQKTGSLWVGYNFSFGDTVSLDLTPMLGGVFGDTQGIAPGYRASLGWRKLDLSSESELLLDTGDSESSFFYTWSELGWTPVEWLRLGMVVQRTKAYETEFDIQRGFLVGLAYKSASFTTYVFNPDTDPTLVLGLVVEF